MPRVSPRGTGAMVIPTVRIVSDAPETNGFIVINEADFDERVHVRYEALAAAKPMPAQSDIAPVAPLAPAKGSRSKSE